MFYYFFYKKSRSVSDIFHNTILLFLCSLPILVHALQKKTIDKSTKSDILYVYTGGLALTNQSHRSIIIVYCMKEKKNKRFADASEQAVSWKIEKTGKDDL